MYDGAVSAWSFVSYPLGDFLGEIADNNNKDYGTTISDLTGYNLVDADVFSVPQNYLSVIDSAYYYPVQFQQGLTTNISTTAQGQKNAVDMLYSN